METVELKAEAREGAGKGVSRRLRRAGKIPGIFYGPTREATTIAIDAREFGRKVADLEGAHLIRFDCPASEINGRVALVKSTQYHPVSGDALHVDFYEVDLTKRIRVAAPLHFTGRPAGVALGGILQPVRREIEVECLPGDIPEFVSVDVSALGIHDSIQVSQIAMPQGVQAVFDDDFTVVTVLAPAVEEVKGGAAGGAEPAAEVAKAESEKKPAAA
jgi:large subunit ribosomal protein L25